MYLVKRHQTYWALHDVPRPHHAKLGRRLAKSLGTADKAEAKRLASLLWLHDWSRKLQGEADRSTEEREALFFRDLIRNAETDAEREALKDHVIHLGWERRDRAIDREDRTAAEAASQFVDIATDTLTAMGDHLDAWIEAIPDTAKTKAMKRAEVLRLAKTHAYIQQVTPEAAEAWTRMLAREHGASSKTIGRILSFVRSYWRYLREQGVVKADPFKGVAPPTTAPSPSAKASGRKKAGWVPFEPSQVVALKAKASADGDGELADLMTLAMWSGARIEELCSLEVGSVDLTGSKSFKVIDAKTDAGVRQVPIHPKAMPTWKRLIGERTAGYVLPDLSANKFGDRSNAIGKRFGRLKKAAGFSEAHVFHSIRKTVVTLLENAGVSENTTADIVGHEKPRITYGLYSGGATLEVKRGALAKLRYPDGKPMIEGDTSDGFVNP